MENTGAEKCVCVHAKLDFFGEKFKISILNNRFAKKGNEWEIFSSPLLCIIGFYWRIQLQHRENKKLFSQFYET